MHVTSIAFIGSSSVYGEADRKEGGYVNRIHKWFIKKQIPIKLYNLGIPGESTDDMLHRAPIELGHRKPQLVVLHIGTNDTGHASQNSPHDISLAEFEKNAYTLITIAKDIAENVLVLTPSPVDDKKNPHLFGFYYYNKDIKEYAKRLVEICNEEKVACMNLYQRFSRIVIKRFLHTDGLHLNANGHERIKQWIISYITDTFSANTANR